MTIVAWAGVGKSTLVNHWLRRMAAKQYRSAELVFGWSFYRQGSSGDTSSADEFLDAALIGSEIQIRVWERRGRRAKIGQARCPLANLIGSRRPGAASNPPGPQEGRVREPCLQALLRELAAFNTGLCVIATRIPVADMRITSASRFCAVTWNNSPAKPVRNCSGRWAWRGLRRNCAC